MTALGIALVWCAMQVTVVALGVVMFCLAARRRSFEIRISAAATGLAAAAALFVLVVAPGPRWWSLTPSNEQSAAESDGARGMTDGNDAASAIALGRGENLSAAQLESVWAAAASEFWRTLTTGGVPALAEVEHERPVWPAWIAWSFAAGVALGAIRLSAGLWSVRRLTRTARPLCEPMLQTLVAELESDGAATPRVELRESDYLTTAATVGWGRPVILLPPQWREWSPAECRAVLAHELAHVRRRDWLACLVAQAVVALHFYHPLVHWLAARLRLEQELAADSDAAGAAGGSQPYLQLLARLALRRPQRRPVFAVRPFLPLRGTLIRRIEMLRHTAPVPRGRTKGRYVVAAALGVVAIAVAGLRPGLVAQDDRQPQKPQAATQPIERQPFSLAYVPPDSLLIVGFRPSELLTQPSLAAIAPAVKALDEQFPKQFALSLAETATVTVALAPPADDDPRPPRPLGLILRPAKPIDRNVLLGRVEHEVQTEGDLRFYDVKGGMHLWFAEDGTVIAADRGEDLQRLVAAGRKGASGAAWADAWQTVSREQGAMLFDTKGFRERYAEQLREGWGNHAALALFSPLWMATTHVVLSESLDEKLSVRLTAWCNEEKDVARVKATLEAAVTMARNALSQFREGGGALFGARVQSQAQRRQALQEYQRTLVAKRQAQEELLAKTENAQERQALENLIKSAKQQELRVAEQLARKETPAAEEAFRRERAMLEPFLKLAEAFLASVEVRSEPGARIVASASVDEGVGPVVSGFLLPAIQKAREAALRTQGMNNLKHIALAFHNYYDANGHFPPAVVIGPDGKTPHSWRVAILPYLNGLDLYREYRLGEPWDSEHNRKLIERVPAVLRSPNDTGEAGNTSYFALTGEGTVFDGDEGTRFREITDGPSNTILVVETKRDIPWTKPEDIPFDPTRFDPEKPLPKLGGLHADGFNAAMCDGSVRFFSETVAEELIKQLTQKADGKPTYDWTKAANSGR
ncbi:MAG: DUF1559 domain-containing protein [Planctomycetes bacterium]|nr:DUF1559 domain-containing protein [Planctomycetota bacterium]